MKAKKFVNLTMFNLVKGAIMIFVLFRHSCNWVSSDLPWIRVIYSVTMPIFFIVSGFWLRKKNLAAGLRVSCVSLLKPYVCAVAFIDAVGLADRLLRHNFSEWLSLFLIPSVLVIFEQSRIGALWFIFALFVAWVLFYLVMMISNEKVQIILAIAAMIVGGLLMPYKLPFQIAQGLVGFSFVYAGYLLRQYKVLERKLQWYVWAGMALLWAIAIMYGSMDLSLGNVRLGAISVAGSICGSIIVLRLVLKLNRFEGKFTDAIRWIGYNSMWYLVFHSIEMTIFPWKFIWKYIPEQSAAGVAVMFFMRFMMVTLACYVRPMVAAYIFRRKKEIE